MPHDHDTDGTSTRRVGLTLAAIASLIVIGVLVWATVFRTPVTPARQVTTSEAPELGIINPTNAPTSPEDVIGSVEGAELQFFDPADESLRGEMTFARLDPQPNGRFFAQEPVAWLFLRNGLSAQITAEELTFRKAAGASEPESGRFNGSVRLQMHRGRLEDAAARAASTPVASLAMDELHFDAALGQLRTTSEVTVDARGVEGAFAGLELVIDEPAKRLSHLSTRAGGWLRQKEAPERTAQELVEPDSVGDSAPGEAREDFYAARLDGGVRIESGARVLTADRLDVWAALLDGELPEGSIAGFVAAASGDSGAQEDDVPGQPRQMGTLRWEGRLVIEPADERPDELLNDALAGRFSSPASGVVDMTDTESGFAATAASMVYSATTRRFALTGAGGAGVNVRVAGIGQATCGRLDLDLTTGLAAMPGAGELRAAADADDTRRTERVIEWTRGATMRLATAGEQVDLSGDWPLESATFEGSVTAREGEASVAGESLTADFARSARSGAAELTRVVVAGDARAVSPGQGRLLGQRLTVDFTTRAADGALTPTTILAEGRALAERGDEGIEAEILTATIGRDPMSDELRIEQLDARLDVLVRGKGGEEALADSLTADPLRGVYDLIGEPVTLRRGTAAVTGDSMRIDEIEQRLTVFGKGELNYREDRDHAVGYERVTVAWAGTMTFDGVMEQAEFVGDCVVVAEPDSLTRDTLRGERIIVEVELDESEGSSQDTASAFRRALIIGEVEELGSGRTAQVESRRYRADPEAASGVALEFLAYLDGPTLIADAATNTLMSPANGRLLFEDRRGTDDSRDGLATRGTTLFEWDGAARFDRATGQAVMTRNVRLRQKAPGDSPVTELECERLDASFALPAGDSDGEGDRGALRAQLTRARASGAVYAQQGARELIADRLEFDAEAGVAQAWANEGNLVTIYDAARPIPLTGSVLRWDLLRDRIEWRDAGTTTAPR